MSGTIFGLGLSHQFDATGTLAAGGVLYIYAAGTTTPATIYEDFNLTSGLELPFPVVADAAGRIPAFWLADGSYDIRFTDASGNELINEPSVTAIGASSGTSSGTSVDSTAIFQTGDPLWLPVSGTRSGWVRMNARTIGSSSSGATERANADAQTLFEYIWNNFTNALCPVSSGRGASAAADWSANKTIGILDMRNKGPFGLGDMGNSDLGDIVGGTPTVAASSGGAETATIAVANLPVYNLDITGLTATPSASPILTPAALHNDGSGATFLAGTSTALTIAIGGTLPLGGSGTALNKMPPYRLGTWYQKL